MKLPNFCSVVKSFFLLFALFFCRNAKLLAKAGNALDAKKKILKTSSNVNSKTDKNNDYACLSKTKFLCKILAASIDRNAIFS